MGGRLAPKPLDLADGEGEDVDVAIAAADLWLIMVSSSSMVDDIMEVLLKRFGSGSRETEGTGLVSGGWSMVGVVCVVAELALLFKVVVAAAVLLGVLMWLLLLLCSSKEVLAADPICGWILRGTV